MYMVLFKLTHVCVVYAKHFQEKIVWWVNFSLLLRSVFGWHLLITTDGELHLVS